MMWRCLVCCLLFFACTESKQDFYLDLMEVPAHFPEIQHPDGNEFTLDRWALGKKLFYEPLLSKNSNISCASCHLPSFAFSDTTKLSIGTNQDLGRRNSPSIANVAFHPYFTREGGVPTLEMQILVPIQEHDEFNHNIVQIADTLKTIEEYVKLSQKAYGQNPNPFVITRAIAQFERSLISGQSEYDKEFFYNIDHSMNDSALRGMELFNSSKADCSSCHSGFNFTNYSFENNGLYEEYADKGREKLTLDMKDRALFKVPSLRNVEFSAPYMHDGSLTTLEEVVSHYNTGGESHFNKSRLVRPLHLTKAEENDLVAFLKSLSDIHFINNPLFQPN